MKSRLLGLLLCFVCPTAWPSCPVLGQEPLTLENSRLGLSFDARTGTLAAVRNKLAGETYPVRGDAFEVEAAEASHFARTSPSGR